MIHRALQLSPTPYLDTWLIVVSAALVSARPRFYMSVENFSIY